jgi:AcrR family transcriptional regulator
MDQHPKHMKISEISTFTKTPAATVRYYVREGLLPKPLKTGKTMAYYSEMHFDRLQTIRRLKKEGLTLHEIKQTLLKNTHAPTPPQDEVMYTRTRESIKTAAIELFREKGYGTTSILDIVTRAKVGKGTFYNCFKSKEALFFECAESVFYDIAKDDPTVRDETDGLKRIWNRTIALTRSTRHIFDMLNLARGAFIRENPAYEVKLKQIMHNFIEPIRVDVETAIAQGHMRKMDSTLLANILIGALEYGLYYGIERTANAEEVVTRGWEIIFSGLGLKRKKTPAKDKL